MPHVTPLREPTSREPIDVARYLARAQCDDEAIEGALVADLGMAEFEAQELIAGNAMELQHQRWAGQADLAQWLWDIGHGIRGSKLSSAQLSTGVHLAYQHLGWARDGRADKVTKGLQQAARNRATTKQGRATGTKLGPTGVAR